MHPARVLPLSLSAVLCAALVQSAEQHSQSTRVADSQHHARRDTRSYPFRARAAFILDELDLRPGDTVVDVGAGDGWWAKRMAQRVGEAGRVYAAEIDKKKVARMRSTFARTPQVRPYLSKADSTELPDDSCDLAFIAQTYHHLTLNSHVRYLRHLRKVLRPTGRLCIIEKHATIATRHRNHGTPLSRLVKEAEEAGWICVRYELMQRTYHYLAIFVQKDLFPPEPKPRKRRRG